MYSLFCIIEKIRTTYHSQKKEYHDSTTFKKLSTDSSSTNTNHNKISIK